jgi:hypothetical protein
VAAAERYKELLTHVARVLKARGFSKRGPTFYSKQEGNWKIISFQKSRKSTANDIVFTVNVAVASTRLIDFFMGSSDPDQPPQVTQCHWRQRLGAEPAESGDKWWTVRSRDSAEKIGEEIGRQILDVAVPQLENLVRDEALRDLWLTRRSPSLTELQRLRNLAVLLGALGPRESLPHVMEELHQVSSTAARFIEKKLGDYNRGAPGEVLDLVGTWISDPEDVEGLREFGRVTLDFQPDGQLTYTAHAEGKDQNIFLTFRIDDGILVTNQPTAPREERTAYSVTPDGKLVLWFGGQRSVYIRQEE